MNYVLSPRERDVLQCAADGASVAATARQLGIAISTTHYHRRNAMVKLRARSISQAAAHAYQRGIIT